MNIQMTNETLLESLQYHESKLGTLRSRPTNDLKEIIRKVYKNDTIRMERISRNSVSDTYFTKLSIPDSTLCKYEEGYIFSEKELETCYRTIEDCSLNLQTAYKKRNSGYCGEYTGNKEAV